MNDDCLCSFIVELDWVLGFLPGFEPKCTSDASKTGKAVMSLGKPQGEQCDLGFWQGPCLSHPSSSLTEPISFKKGEQDILTLIDKEQ